LPEPVRFLEGAAIEKDLPSLELWVYDWEARLEKFDLMRTEAREFLVDDPDVNGGKDAVDSGIRGDDDGEDLLVVRAT
jgi:hypothetical protein